MKEQPVRSSPPASAPAARCRSCGELGLERVLDLGFQPVADWLVPPHAPEPEPRYPLAVDLCPSCVLLQLAPFEHEEQVQGHEHVSAASSTVAKHDAAWAEEAGERIGLGPTSVVVEAEGGGGGVAAALATQGAQVLAINDCPRGRADLVVANHSLAHALDLDRAIADLISPLAPGGTVTVEFHHAARLLSDTQFDLICHPHRTYLSVAALVKAFARHGLTIIEAAEIPLHGGSVRAYARCGTGSPGPGVTRLLAAERMAGLDGVHGHRRLAPQVREASRRVRAFLMQAHADGKRVLGYGAPSRASTLLNHCRITAELLPATVDRSRAKQGKALPGCRVPIDAPSLLGKVKPDFVLILAWTLTEEIMAQLPEVRAWGGRFVVPLPDVKVLP